MFNREKFEKYLEKNKKSIGDIAGILNIGIATIYRRMKGKNDFLRSEIEVLVNELGIKDIKEVFFWGGEESEDKC